MFRWLDLQIPINFVLHISASVLMFFHHRYNTFSRTRSTLCFNPFFRCRSKWANSEKQQAKQNIWMKKIIIKKFSKIINNFPCSCFSS